MLDKYKAAVSKERSDRRKAAAVMKKQGLVSMLANEMDYDYDGQFPTAGEAHQMAYLSHRLTQVETQMKVTEEAEAAASRQKVEKEREAKLIDDNCRGLLKFVAQGLPEELSQEAHDEIMAKYMESNRSKTEDKP